MTAGVNVSIGASNTRPMVDMDAERARIALMKSLIRLQVAALMVNVWGWIQDCPEDPSLASVCRRVGGGLAVCLALGEDGKSAWAGALAEIGRFEAEGVLDDAPQLLQLLGP